MTPEKTRSDVGAVDAAPLTPDEQKRRAEQEEATEFLVFLGSFRRGAFALEFARAMRTLTKAVREHGKGGKVTVVFEVKPVRNAPPGSVQVADKIEAKPPRGERPMAVMFSTSDGALTLDHPDQVAAFEIPGRTGGNV
jgi:hypothetical protein